MYSGKRQKFDWVFVLYLTDFTSTLLSFVISPLAFLALSLPASLTGIHFATFGIMGVYLAFLRISMDRFPLYSWSTFMNQLTEFRLLLYSIGLGAALFEAFLKCLNFGVPLIYHWAFFQSVVTFFTVWVFRLLSWYTMVKLLDLIPKERIVFVGWSPKMRRVINSFRREMRQFQTVVGYIKCSPSSYEVVDKLGFKELGGIEELEAIHDREDITLLVIDEQSVTGDQLRVLGSDCSRLIINFRLIPGAFDILGRRLVTRVIAGVPVLGIQGVQIDLFQNRLSKRLVDILGALVGLTLSLPLIIIFGILIYIESPGPIFYRQVRLGQGGASFNILKLRSMKLDAEKSGTGWTVENDPRRLKIGGFMRRKNIDEVPQFWNVLMGEMSLVGPRPERPEYVDTFSKDYRHYNLRHYCKPGITSWAAVHGFRGNTSLTDRLDYDLFYLENWSLALDFKIMLMTLIGSKNAY